jgi:hypothetical protein
MRKMNHSPLMLLLTISICLLLLTRACAVRAQAISSPGSENTAGAQALESDMDKIYKDESHCLVVCSRPARQFARDLRRRNLVRLVVRF